MTRKTAVSANRHAHADLPSKTHAHAHLVTATLGGIEIVLPDTEIALWDLAVSELNQSGIHAARAGYVLNVLKEKSGHGDFMQALNKRGIGKRDAQNCMRIAAALAALTPEQQKKLTTLGKTKLLALVKLPEETLEDLVDGSDLDDIAQMSARQLQDYARRLRHDLEKAEMREARARQQAGEARAAQSGFRYPPSIDRIRVESSALANQATLCLDDIEQLMTELNSAPDLSDAQEKAQAEYSAGATTLFVNLQAIHAKAAYLVKWFGEIIGEDYMPTQPEDAPTLTDDEALRVFALRDLLLAEHRAAKIARDNRPRRGRPRKAK